MSIPVDVHDLEQALADFGAGYLLTVSPQGRVKAVTVEPVVVDGGLLVDAPGRGSSVNVAANAQVTVLFPPREPRGYTLIVDATAAATGDGGSDVLITPTGAVLHRPAAHADGPVARTAEGAGEACGHDCGPVT